MIKVSRKGQITIPKEIRDRLKISVGDYLIVRLIDDKIVIEKPYFPDPGEPVGIKEYRRIISELEETRNKWA